MAQISIYLPEELETKVRRRARRGRQSVSAYLVSLVRKDVSPDAWPDGFASLYSSCGGELPEAPDPAPDEVAGL